MTSIEQDGAEVKQTREEWLRNLKTGDMVYCVSRFDSRDRYVKKPSEVKVTAKQITTDHRRFSLDGRATYHRIIPATSEALDAFFSAEEHRDWSDSIGRKLSRLTADQLRRIEAICKEGTE